MKKVPGMHILNSLDLQDELRRNYHLISEHEYSFDTKFSLAIVEEIFERRTQEIDYHYIIITFNSVPMNVRNANYIELLKSAPIKMFLPPP